MDTPLLNHLTKEDYNHVYEPAEDSFLLLDALEDDLEELKRRNPLIGVELGSGSGINITALSKALPNSFCIAIDINPFACRATLRTATANSTTLDCLNMDLFTNLRPGTIDLLIFNPPYVPTETLGDEQTFQENAQLDVELIKSWSGGPSGCDVIYRLIDVVYDKLAQGSLFYLLLLKENNPEEILERLTKLNFTAKIVKQRKIRGEHLFILKIEKE